MNPKTAAKWVEAHEHCQKTRAPSVLSKYAEGKYKAAIRVLMDTKPKVKIRMPRGTKAKTPQGIKKDLKKELEALCKAIVFTRDCGSPEAREGSCISCGEWRVLQWGHFIAQNHSKYLQYDPRNSAGQCAGCNGPGGRGRPMEFADAINKREGWDMAVYLRALDMKTKDWRANKISLSQKLEELRKHPLAPKAEGPTKSKQKGSV